MASAKKCDRCNSYYDAYRGVRVKRKTKSNIYDDVDYISFANCYGVCFSFDLCPSCMASTLLFMNIPKEQVNYHHEEDAEGSEEE